MIGQRAKEPVQLPSGRVHVRRGLCIIEGEKLQPEFFSMLRLNSYLRSGAKKLLNATVPEALITVYIV
jgi:hypothetical protein